MMFPDARSSRGKTLPQFTVGDYVLVARVSRQGKHRKLMALGPGCGVLLTTTTSTCTQCSTWSQPNCATFTSRGCGFTPMTSSRLPASSARFSNNWRARASTTSGASLLSIASGDEIGVKVAWEGLEEAESTREPPSWAFHDAPDAWGKDLKALRLTARF